MIYLAWIKEVSRNDNRRLEKIYNEAEKRTNKSVANVLKIHSVNPDVLEIHMKLYEQIMFGESILSIAEREMIGVVVSKANECPYCVSHHSEALFHVCKDKELMKKVSKNYHEANLNEKQLLMCKYVDKLTRTPYKMVEDDIITLREIGFNDEAIFDINQICAYFNYVNRIVHGLGVELE